MADRIIIGCFIIMAILLFSLGWYSNNIYKDYSNERKLDGIYIENANYEQAREITKMNDKKGDWVCINVAYDMPMDRAYDVCVHECSHKAFSEIFAEKCEDDEVKCKEYLK
jgi:hypothetical protein